IAMRAASIWRLVTHPASSAFRPKSPACTVVWPFEVPRRRPRWYLRNLVFFGSSTYDLPFFEPRLPEPAPLVFSALGSPDWSSFVGSSTCFLVVVVSGASATGASTVGVSGSTGGCSRPSAEVAVSSVRGRSTLSWARGRPRPPPGRRGPPPPPPPPWPPWPRRRLTGPRPS